MACSCHKEFGRKVEIAIFASRIIQAMKIYRNRFLPLRGFTAINLFGLMLVRPRVHVSARLVNHESIHTAQMRELGYILFYVLYVVEWLLRLPLRGNAYRGISFEREAYAHEHNPTYLSQRHHYAWIHYLKSPQKRKKK